MANDSGDSRRTSGPWYASDPPTDQFPAVGEVGSGLPGLSGPSRHARPAKRRKVILVVAAAALAVVAGIAAVIVTVVTSGGNPNATGFAATGSSPAQDAGQITSAFLQAWQSGDLGQAARYTDSPAAARAALAAYSKDLHLRKLTATTESDTVTATGASSTPRESAGYAVSVTVAASDSARALHGTWSYHASLVAYQQRNSQLWYIAWAPDVLAPNLTGSTHLAAVTVAPQVISVNDASGNELTSYHDAGLTTIANLLQQTPPPGQGTPGLYVEIQTAKNQLVPNTQAVVVAPSTIPNLDTTISATAEAAARAAVAKHQDSSMIAIQPSTGDILAIANNDGYNDFALTAAVAPGSTMKVITSTALINEGVVTANSGVACPESYTVQGITYHNDDNESEPASAPFSTDFAQSCNNAFSSQWPHLTGGRLASTAKEYFGLDHNWDIGLPGLSASYFNAPASASGSELAQEAFGEGQLTASPLAMASVAATVDTGTFRQPILRTGTRQVTATALPASTDAQLKEMMQDVVTSGTAAAIGFGPGVYAKTGTADIQGQEQPNSWLIAFDPAQDVAVACLVVNAGYGAQYAGPEVKAFLSKL
ncbi:MAG TPA: penicillin-binding transpeptidase domain-containing protein [Streptosporangiaceae bacterium]|nr:penicillin-binding transpeptidase domain-containing protein [Streptosporangiaceae bacterium]